MKMCKLHLFLFVLFVMCPLLASATYLGCFEDTATRDLASVQLSWPTSNSPDACIEYCASKGFQLAGLQAGFECRCDNTRRHPEYAQRPDAECNRVCTGDSLGLCGGGWRQSIHRTDSTYLGCYQDAATRDLSAVQLAWQTTNAPAACVSYCSSRGYELAGLQAGFECRCDHVRHQPQYARVSDAQCNSTCTGDANMHCGGRWRQAIYRVITPSASTPAATTPTAPPVTTTPTTTSPSSFVSDLFIRPFNATSAWNLPVTSLGAKVDLTKCSFGVNPWPNRLSYSPGVYVAKSSDPVWTVVHPRGTITGHAPQSFSPAIGTDSELVWVIGDDVWSMWGGVIDGSYHMSVKLAIKCSAKGTGFGAYYGDKAGTRASGFSLLGGLITRQALAAGKIQHALHAAIPRSSLALPSISPATSADSGASTTYTGCHHYGARYAIPKTVPCPSTNPIAQIVWTALQEYGLILGDATSKGMALNLERTMTTASDESAVAGIMQAIVNNLHYVAATAPVAKADESATGQSGSSAKLSTTAMVAIVVCACVAAAVVLLGIAIVIAKRAKRRPDLAATQVQLLSQDDAARTS